MVLVYGGKVVNVSEVSGTEDVTVLEELVELVELEELAEDEIDTVVDAVVALVVLLEQLVHAEKVWLVVPVVDEVEEDVVLTVVA